ncbi:MAG: hypothetical protein OXM61_17115 [Candidatus Poribacteria bacterium]|nr:hypothetical protein [Candidatus Poribacteria bacterium]
MSSYYKMLGRIDVDAFLRSRNGMIDLNLIDAGRIRPISQQYEWETDTSGGHLLLRPIRTKSSNTKDGDVLIPQFINLTPETIAFMGAYDGDGNKTNKIGFAQNNIQLQDFVSRGLQALFGDSFDSQVTILEDEKYFQGDDIIDKMDLIKQEWINRGRPEDHITERELQEEILRLKYNAQYGGSPPDEPIKFVISSKKGALAPGGSAYEIIRAQLRSERFLPFLLAIIKACVDSIIQDSVGSNEITWLGPPLTYHQQYFDLKSYVESGKCCYVTEGGKNKQYEIYAEQGRLFEPSLEQANLLWIQKQNGRRFAVPVELPLSPILCLMLGYYLAEGSSSKSAYFTFREKYEQSISLGFNSSEEDTLRVFFNGLDVLFPNSRADIVTGWLVKIGSKYFPESITVAEKSGIPLTRRGPKGQGAAGSIEFTKTVRDWALDQFPLMKLWTDKFLHIEFTGAGVPRVDIRCASFPAQFLAAVICDLLFFSEDIEEFIHDR